MRLDVTLDPEKVTGSAMVVNAVGASDEAADAMSLTQQFLNEHVNNPYAEEEDLWSKAVQNDRNPGGFLSSYKPDQKAPTPEPELMFRQFPQMQQSTTRLDPSYSGKIMPMNRQALVISNGDYPGTGSDLDWAHKDGGSMKKYFSSQGYETTYLKDVSGGDISKALKSTSKQNFFPGDSVAVYYVGHGDQTGLIGTDFTSAPYTALNTIALGALSGGYHAQIITDCCHSGAMVGSLSKTLETEFGNVKRDFTELSIDTEKAASQDLHKFDENGKMSKEILDKANQRELYTTRF